jgi:hypothetical protein
MKRYTKQTIISLILTLSIITQLTACAYADTDSTDQPITDISSTDETPQTPTIPKTGVYDSEDAAIVVAKDLENKTVQFQNITSSRRYTLEYNGTTAVYDKNDQALSMGQLPEGSVVTVRFYMPTKTIAYVKENPNCVNYENVTNYSMNLNKGTISVGSNAYSISGSVVVLSDGQETDMMALNQVDAISMWGYKNMIYSISVEKGHGYLRLTNEDYFVDGWLEVENSTICKITKDMLVIVPEGTYKVTVSNKGTVATQEITFNRNEEMAWDLGDVEIAQVQTGNIIFTLNPLNAKVVIDGKEVNAANTVTLDYGLHRMQISADGYDTVSQYIKVAEPSANISVELEKTEEESSTQSSTQSATDTLSGSLTTQDDDDKEEEESSVQPESESIAESTTESVAEVAQATTDYKVYIDAPEGVEAYLDGNYIGITPTSFEKVAGSYVISLRKTGYQTRSYTLQIDNEEKDLNYTFTDLIALEE